MDATSAKIRFAVTPSIRASRRKSAQKLEPLDYGSTNDINERRSLDYADG